MMKLISGVHGILRAEATNISITFAAERTFEVSSRKTFMDALREGSNFLWAGMKVKMMFRHGSEYTEQSLFLSVSPIILPCCPALFPGLLPGNRAHLPRARHNQPVPRDTCFMDLAKYSGTYRGVDAYMHITICTKPAVEKKMVVLHQSY